MERKHSELLNKDLAMNKAEYEALYKQHEALRNKVANDPWHLGYHIMPDSGWVNDPNGLCQYHGIYHIYYQYSPFDVEGKTKLWGHMTSKDLLHFKQEEPVLFPDSRCDERGVYSGSAFIEDDTIHYFYTGNVKLMDQDYDFINAGREQNLIHVESKDGIHLSDKEWLMTNSDYPQDMSCHVRDPKIYKQKDTYYMVLGARDLTSHGCVLVFESSNLKDWSYKMRFEKENFGYMWECPDLFDLDGEQFMITCPQGLSQKGYHYQNVYQCGYFPMHVDFDNETYTMKDFCELDYGFDFYAPQSFEDEKGRRILIGWMGLPDIDYTNPTTENGWQHALTLPRVLTSKTGVIYQTPVEELRQLRTSSYTSTVKAFNDLELLADCYEMAIDIEKQDNFVLQLRKGACLSYDIEKHLLCLSFDACGYGRDKRYVEVEDIKNILVYADTSSLEIFVNDGAIVFTSRVYTTHEDNQIRFMETAMDGNVHFYELGKIQIETK